ncbi:hypothetical protein HRI96_03705 [Treponema parvum]|uniref:FeoB-associated Cys-rich membrane protein n=1 Tax=Treponema parvum TaxID=138851 RepID=A0A975EZ85_9SPIR|nr:hypothetical protein [Treponema parvum]QTQ11380.1 hypothetical protein HRI96_03705 [Treponema parvum]QTQ16678.1 hypothetical protein HXT04_08240 [Treponema parvum]
MVANLVAGGLLLCCIAGAVFYILRQRKIAIENNNPICIGCPGAASCRNHCHGTTSREKKKK